MTAADRRRLLVTRCQTALDVFLDVCRDAAADEVERAAARGRVRHALARLDLDLRTQEAVRRAA